MRIIIRAASGQTRTTEIDRSKLLKSGGEGEIFRCIDDPGTVLKLFKKVKAAKEAKLWAMLTHAPHTEQATSSGGKVLRLAWPQGVAYDGAGRFVGYAMPYLEISETITMQELLSDLLRERFGLRGDGPTDYRFRLAMAINLSMVLEYLHGCGHAVVDLKPQNILVNRQTGVVTLIDTDSFRIEAGDKVFPAEVATPEYLAPEMTSDFTKAGIMADLFALGVILSQVLNNDLHPATGVVTHPPGTPDDMVTRLRQGIVTLNPEFQMEPHGRSIESYLPRDVRDLLRAALIAEPEKRPTARDWRKKLIDLHDNRLRSCSNDPEHVTFSSSCPWCAIDDHVGGGTQREAAPSSSRSTPRPAQRSARPASSGARRSAPTPPPPAPPPQPPPPRSPSQPRPGGASTTSRRPPAGRPIGMSMLMIVSWPVCALLTLMGWIEVFQAVGGVLLPPYENGFAGTVALFMAKTVANAAPLFLAAAPFYITFAGIAEADHRPVPWRYCATFVAAFPLIMLVGVVMNEFIKPLIYETNIQKWASDVDKADGGVIGTILAGLFFLGCALFLISATAGLWNGNARRSTLDELPDWLQP